MPEDTQGVRLRPEEILAQTFAAPLSPQSTDSDWSPRARRLFLMALAIAGAVLVTTGLLLTGELGPIPGAGGGTTPVNSGPSASVLSERLLRNTDEPGAPPSAVPTPTTAPGLHPHSISPIVIAPSQSTDPSQPQSTPTTAPTSHTKSTTPPPTPTTTIPCSLLGSRALGSQLPPLCR